MEDQFVCSSCQNSLDWNDCVREEVVSRIYGDCNLLICVDCMATDLLCNSGTHRLEDSKARHDELADRIRKGKYPYNCDEDYCPEDPYDDRDFEYDWEGRKDQYQPEF